MFANSHGSGQSNIRNSPESNGYYILSMVFFRNEFLGKIK